MAARSRGDASGNHRRRRVRITGCRDFDYRSTDDFTVRYDERKVSLSHLTWLDFFVSYWKRASGTHILKFYLRQRSSPMHLHRNKAGGRRRLRPIASLFKQFELVYVVGDERDIVRVRTNYRNEEVYLYRIMTSPENARRLFLVYIDRINQLADHAEFYHLLSNSCTSTSCVMQTRQGESGDLISAIPQRFHR